MLTCRSPRSKSAVETSMMDPCPHPAAGIRWGRAWASAPRTTSATPKKVAWRAPQGAKGSGLRREPRGTRRRTGRTRPELYRRSGWTVRM